MTEINPEHPVTKLMHQNWHAVVAVIMAKFKLQEIEITEADVEYLMNLYPTGMPTVCMDARGGGCRIRLMSMEEALPLAAKEKVN